MPADCCQGNGALYAAAIKSMLPMSTEDGVMPESGPGTVEKVLKMFNPAVKKADVDLGETYTTEFVKKAAENSAG